MLLQSATTLSPRSSNLPLEDFSLGVLGTRSPRGEVSQVSFLHISSGLDTFIPRRTHDFCVGRFAFLCSVSIRGFEPVMLRTRSGQVIYG